MDINTVDIAVSTLGTSRPASSSGNTKIGDDIKRSDQTPTHLYKDNKSSKELNSFINSPQTSMGFIMDEDLSENMVAAIKNKKTDETIRLVPTEEQLKIRKQMTELTGLILDLTA